MDVENEIRELQRRVGDLEGAVNVLTGQLGTVSPKLNSLQEETGARFDALAQSLAAMVGRLDNVNNQLWSLRDDLPEMLRMVLGSGGQRGN